ncbi:hypothetical protein MtrunA17_Chr3g0104541 [Medicago truncatula]|uniref:Uncharacterized protein n=1 Tax=Medicago truncatula TaxID=3880 RepID=A0A396IQI7_MEDTR|nr:hypothetical protein MtrunA17_Chr3g0104541 [Medicago truncatula]
MRSRPKNNSSPNRINPILLILIIISNKKHRSLRRRKLESGSFMKNILSTFDS